MLSYKLYPSIVNQTCSMCLSDFTSRRGICYTNVSTCGLSLSDFDKCLTDRVYPCPMLPNGTQLARSVYNLSDCIVCMPGWYINTAGICMKCSVNCTTCNTTHAKCTTCIPDYFVYGIDFSCRLLQDGFYIDPVDSYLKDCNLTKCSACSIVNDNCTAPNVNSGSAYLLPNGSIGVPGPGFMYTEGSIIACDSSCSTCQWSPYSCRSCSAGMSLDESDWKCRLPMHGWNSGS